MQNFSYSLRHFLSIFATGIIPLFLLFFVLDEIIYSLFGMDVELEESILNFMKNNQIILSIFSIPIVMMVGYTMNAISHFFETMPIMNFISQKLKNYFFFTSLGTTYVYWQSFPSFIRIFLE